MAIIQRTYTSTCHVDLLNAVNLIPGIPTCMQVYSDGAETYFEFASTLSGPQTTSFDALLSTYTCPVHADVAINSGVVLDDTSLPDVDVIWSSDKVDEEIQAALTSAGLGDMACLQVRDTVGNTNIPLTYTDLNFDTIDVANFPAVINRDPTNTNRVYVYETGMYMISYTFTCDDEITVRLMLNGTTEIPGSITVAGEAADVNDVIVVCSKYMMVNLTAGNYFTTQIKAVTTAEILKPGGILTVTRLKGARGDTGPNGSGLINVKEEGTALAGQYTTLNFIGAQVAATDAGSNQANITVTASTPVFGSNYQYAESLGTSTNNSVTYVTKTTFTTPSLTSGTYRIGWTYNYNHDATTNSFLGRITVNGTAVNMQHQHMPNNSAGNDPTGTNSSQKFLASGFINVTLSGVNVVNLDFASETAAVISGIWNARMEFWRIS